ncbi:MAG TPA: MarR family transcriptional regulator [Cellulomonas sp.]|uniref:MarR family winged helix-turn-helix transcriptional regulator n=1 Tax=Cellulomonas sp. TaxID=40001 RepID=UPI002E31FE4A|nr:MarR family transcriptional regulator [Cellulomonas sp.]HEX5332200.1 MarR family transcriptional regulator [Cellulomonas sp.]
MTEDLPERLRRLPTWMLSQAAARAHRLLAEALADSDARGHHYRLLAALQDQGPTNQVVLGHRTALDRSDVAVGLAELEQRGLAHRDPDPDDGRRKRVQITDAGTRFLADLDEVVGAVQDEVLHQLTPEERRTFLDLLTRLQPSADDAARRAT